MIDTLNYSNLRRNIEYYQLKRKVRIGRIGRTLISGPAEMIDNIKLVFDQIIGLNRENRENIIDINKVKKINIKFNIVDGESFGDAASLYYNYCFISVKEKVNQIINCLMLKLLKLNGKVLMQISQKSTAISIINTISIQTMN